MLAGLFFKKDEQFVGQPGGAQKGRELWPRFEGRGGVKNRVQCFSRESHWSLALNATPLDSPRLTLSR
jgi:hypothetical protein